jgi:glutamate/tyrosine decarboxylase-like PLP-dependent enzyme
MVQDATMAVALEQKALDMVLELLDIPSDWFKGRTVTTGATASNIMGLGTYPSNSPSSPLTLRLFSMRT